MEILLLNKHLLKMNRGEAFRLLDGVLGIFMRSQPFDLNNNFRDGFMDLALPILTVAKGEMLMRHKDELARLLKDSGWAYCLYVIEAIMKGADSLEKAIKAADKKIAAEAAKRKRDQAIADWLYYKRRAVKSALGSVFGTLWSFIKFWGEVFWDMFKFFFYPIKMLALGVWWVLKKIVIVNAIFQFFREYFGEKACPWVFRPKKLEL